MSSLHYFYLFLTRGLNGCLDESGILLVLRLELAEEGPASCEEEELVRLADSLS